MKKFISKKKGFVLLFSVVLSSIILSIALGVTNIALKEINFSTSGVKSNEAFYAADTGIECALYYDLLPDVPDIGQDINETVFGFFKDPTLVTKCGGVPVDLNYGPLADDPTGPWNFSLPNLGMAGQACAIVTVTKDPTPPTTNMISQGYNTGWDTVECGSTFSDPKRTERVIEVNY